KGFHPVVTESTRSTLCVSNAYLYGSAAEGGGARLEDFPGMAKQLAQHISEGIVSLSTPKAINPTDFSLLPLDSYITGYQGSDYYLEPLSGDNDAQQYKMLKGFTANRLLHALLMPEQVPPALCAHTDEGRKLYLLHKRIDTKFLAKNVEELLGLTDPKLKISGLRHLFTIDPQGKTIISLQEGGAVPVTQRIRTKLALALLGGLNNLDESQLYMVLFPYERIKNKLPPSLVEKDNPAQYIAIPALQGTIGHNLLTDEAMGASANQIAFARAFRNTEDPSPLALPLKLIQGLTGEQSRRRMLVRISAYQDMTSYEFINSSVDIFEFFIMKVNKTHQRDAASVAQKFYERVDISLRIFTILQLREWSLSVGFQEAASYLKQYYQLCNKHGIMLHPGHVDLSEQSMWRPSTLENPYLDRTIQARALDMFVQLESLRSCDHYRLRLLRMDITALPENKKNMPLYRLSDIIYDYIKRDNYIEEAERKVREFLPHATSEHKISLTSLRV
ncbi:MAG TPA: hypothetical protein VI522_01310, partial [Gammaproteobacteria bacterium]|nr:hypothetical protein [Gammaproteobacteria bacterium]